LIRGGSGSNLLSIQETLIKINKINLLRMNPRKRIPWGKYEYHQYNVGGGMTITYTNISLIEEIK
jgi:hypothetical protein